MTSHIENQFPANNRGLLLRILLLGFVFFVLTGQGLAQNKSESKTTEKKSFFSYFQKKKSTESSGNSLSPLSWFRSKQDTPSKVDHDSKKPPTISKSSTSSQKSEPKAKTLDDFSSNDLNVAPFPPENPYYERNQKPVSSQQSVDSVSISESVELPDPDTVPASAQHSSRLATSNDLEEPLLTGVSSYSFDTRDWVESFPVDHVTDSLSSNHNHNQTVQNQTVQNQNQTVQNRVAQTRTVQNSVAQNHAATVVSNVPAGQQGNLGVNSQQWDGQAVPITEMIGTVSEEMKTVRQASLNQTSLRRSASEQHTQSPQIKDKEIETINLGIDLTPSYAPRLKYCEIYGMVVVQANFPLTEIKSILEEIKQLQIDLNLYMGIPAPKEKIELCLFRDEKTYMKFLQEVFPKAPRDRRALYIKIDDKPGTLLVQKTDEFEIDLRHEMTHAIIHTSIATVPIWLDEGLAKYFEVPIKDRAEKNPYMKQIRWNTKLGAVPSLSRLEKLEHIGQMGDREYRDSWAWVHFLIHHSPQSHRLLAGYLQLLSTLPAENAKNQNSTQIPSISLYLNEVVVGAKEKYREHFNK
ncbi:MAG: DUF1570 domain-containing protein [Planctomycetaceae bacterium]|jgi:hypothetical protein|nr:DUF1570 domain-containing protein [Planctomycetaceae bacterium]